MKHVPPPQLDTECTLASLRTVSARLKLIDLRIAEIGLALKRGTITPGRAIALCEECCSRLPRHHFKRENF